MTTTRPVWNPATLLRDLAMREEIPVGAATACALDTWERFLATMDDVSPTPPPCAWELDELANLLGFCAEASTHEIALPMIERGLRDTWEASLGSGLAPVTFDRNSVAHQVEAIQHELERSARMARYLVPLAFVVLLGLVAFGASQLAQLLR